MGVGRQAVWMQMCRLYERGCTGSLGVGGQAVWLWVKRTYGYGW